MLSTQNTKLYFIDPRGSDPRQTELASQFAALQQALGGIQTALTAFNDAHSRRVPPNNRRYETREYSFEIAYIKLERAIEQSARQRETLWQTADSLRRQLLQIDAKTATRIDHIASHNAACAFELANDAVAVAHRTEMGYRHGRRSGIAHYYLTIGKAFAKRTTVDYSECATELLMPEWFAAQVDATFEGAYNRVATMIQDAWPLILHWQDAQSNRIYQEDHALYLPRERAFEASVLAIELLSEQLTSASAELHELTEQIAGKIDGSHQKYGMRGDAIIAHNVLCATELRKQATEVLTDLSGYGKSRRMEESGIIGIPDGLQKRGEGTAERQFNIGLNGKLDGNPPAPHMTHDEAQEYGDWFTSYANGMVDAHPVKVSLES